MYITPAQLAELIDKKKVVIDLQDEEVHDPESICDTINCKGMITLSLKPEE